MHEPITTTKLLYHALVAFFGAIVHATKAHRTGQSKTITDFFTLTVMSSFSGAMFAFVGLHTFGSGQLYLTMALAGTGGYLGVEGLAMISERVRKLLLGK